MRKTFSLAAVSAATLVGMASTAHANLIVTIGDGTSSVTCNNTTAAGVALCAGSGFITAVGGNNIVLAAPISIGSFTIGGTLTSTNNPGGASTFLNQSTLTVSNSNALGGFFFVDLLSQGFTLPAGPDLTLFGSSGFSSNTGATGSVNNRYFADPTNLGVLSNEISCSYAITTNNSCAAPTTGWTRGAGAFALRQIQEFTLTSSALNLNSTNNLIVANVPEPLSASLVGLGLLAAGLASRRAARKAA